MRSVVSVAFDELYDLLSNYNESPKMTKDVFIWWQGNEYVYRYNIELQSLILSFEKPFSCQLLRNNNEKQILTDIQVNELNNLIQSVFIKIHNLSMFL